jgi:lipopolysaccharide transport system permease protein
VSAFELVIKPRKGWQPIDLAELWSYRELLGFFIWRDIKIRYKQTLLGGLWAVLQPLIAMLIFGVLFTRVVTIRTDSAPYPLFIFAGLVPWTFFANAVGLSSNSLVSSEQMIRKIYFPRVLVPLGTVFALGLDMLVSLLFMGVLMVYYHWSVSWSLLLLPVFLLGSCLCSAGLGLILCATNVRYRDVKYAVPFFIQMAFFLTPVVYPLRNVPYRFRIFLGLNPMAGIIEGFRYALLGTPISSLVLWTAMGEGLLVFVVGLFFFRRMERTFADVI